jgi:hypothetical protein
MKKIILYFVCIFLFLSCKENKTTYNKKKSNTIDLYLKNIEKFNSDAFLSISEKYLLDKDSLGRINSMRREIALYDTLEFYRGILMKVDDSFFNSNRSFTDFLMLNPTYIINDSSTYSYLDFENDKMYKIYIQENSEINIEIAPLKPISKSERFDYFRNYWHIKSLNEMYLGNSTEPIRMIITFNTYISDENHKYSITVDDPSSIFLEQFFKDIDYFTDE